MEPSIDPDHTGVNHICDPLAPFQIGSPHASSKAISGIIRYPYGLLLTLGVGIRIVDDDSVRGLQVEAPTSCPDREEEDDGSDERIGRPWRGCGS